MMCTKTGLETTNAATVLIEIKSHTIGNGLLVQIALNKFITIAAQNYNVNIGKSLLPSFQRINPQNNDVSSFDREVSHVQCHVNLSNNSIPSQGISKRGC